MQRDALISECGSFRYWLTRVWDERLPTLAFIMLNPSTADASADDPTIRKCVGFAQRNGFGGISVVNLFAYRATDPAELKRAGWPVGPANDLEIGRVLYQVHRAGGKVVCAWGVNARRHERVGQVAGQANLLRVPLHALRVTADNVPCHPLMLPYSCQLQEWRL
jgi:hypothetical protein